MVHRRDALCFRLIENSPGKYNEREELYLHAVYVTYGARDVKMLNVIRGIAHLTSQCDTVFHVPLLSLSTGK